MIKRLLLILLLIVIASPVKAQDSLYCNAIVVYVENDVPIKSFDLTSVGAIVPLVFNDNVYFTDNYLTVNGNISFFKTDYNDQAFLFSVKVMPALILYAGEKGTIKLTAGTGLGYIVAIKADSDESYKGVSYPIGGTFQFFHFGKGEMIGFAVGDYYYLIPDKDNLNSVTLTLLYSFLSKERCWRDNVRIKPIFSR